MKSKETILIVASVLILVAMALGAYWYFLMGPVQTSSPATSASNSTSGGFQPLNRGGNGQTASGSSTANASSTTASASVMTTSAPLATLRLLSSAPVGGYGASTTAKTTVVRWVDRGRGNVYEASYDSSAITTISNTVVPRIYESVWNKNLTAFIGSIFQDGDTSWMAVYSQLNKQGTSTATNSSDPAQLAPFSLKGKKLPSNMIGYAASPRKDKLFILTNESGSGAGYVSNLDGTSMIRIFTTPLTELNIDWPSDNIIAITTKGSAHYSGFLYFVNPKTGTWSQILGPISGLSASVSHDGKYVLWSGTGGNGDLTTGVYTISKKTTSDAGILTLAEKCAWGNVYTAIVYCAVPSSLASASGTYPDDWYKGTISSTDKIWKTDVSTGDVELVSNLIGQADRAIDGFDLGLDPKDAILFFMNKNDLSLWSLDLSK